MPATKDGLHRMLEFFVYGILKSAESVGNAHLFLRMIEENGLRRFMTVNMPDLQTSSDPVQACREYTKHVDKSGLFDGSDTLFSGNGDEVRAEIGERCIYRRVCTMRSDEHLQVHCIRSVALAEMLRVRLKADFTPRLEEFGLPCHLELRRAQGKPKSLVAVGQPKSEWLTP